ncbi:hypothetical protein ACTVJH_06155 [Desulfoplanes sp. PS50]
MILYQEDEISEEDVLIEDLKQYKDKQTIVIVKLINKGFSRYEIHHLLAKIYPEKKDKWAKSRLKLYESAYGFLGFFDASCSTFRINVKRKNINKSDLDIYLQSNNITEQKLISLYEELAKKYDEGIIAINSKEKDRNKILITLLNREIGITKKTTKGAITSRRKMTCQAKDATMPWKRILVRSGFLGREQEAGFSLEEETPGNRNYLDKILAKGQFGEIRENIFMPNEAQIDEAIWLAAVENLHSGAESGRADDLEIMDTYMAGLVRWLNYIDIKMTFSCDGHGQRPPKIDVSSHDIEIALWILKTRSHFFRKHAHFSISYQQLNQGRDVSPAHTTNRYRLLEVAEWLHEKRDELKDLVGKMRNISERGGRPGMPRA